MTIPDGFKVPGVLCRLCGQSIPIPGDPLKLPPEFEAECPTCSGTETYRQDEIQMLAVPDTQSS